MVRLINCYVLPKMESEAQQFAEDLDKQPDTMSQGDAEKKIRKILEAPDPKKKGQ